MNSKNSKTSQPYVLMLNLTDKRRDLRRDEKNIYYIRKNIKSS